MSDTTDNTTDGFGNTPGTVSVPFTVTVPTPHAGVCPSCGHCPSCGRRNAAPSPWYPAPYPWWGVYPYGGTFTVSSGVNTYGYSGHGQ